MLLLVLWLDSGWKMAFGSWIKSCANCQIVLASVSLKEESLSTSWSVNVVSRAGSLLLR